MTMIYTHVMQQGVAGVQSPLDLLSDLSGDEVRAAVARLLPGLPPPWFVLVGWLAGEARSLVVRAAPRRPQPRGHDGDRRPPPSPNGSERRGRRQETV